MNTFINTQIELKKLRFHTSGPDGKTKWHVTKMHDVTSDAYLAIVEMAQTD